MIKEYRDLTDADRSVVTVLATRNVVNDYSQTREWILRHHTAGFECAGSCARSTVEKWTVTSFSNGSRFGNSFLNESDACEVFNSDKPWYRDLARFPYTNTATDRVSTEVTK